MLSTRSYDPRHRAARKATAKLRLWIVCLALPAVAVASVTFGTTEAGMATSTKAFTVIQKAAQPAEPNATLISDPNKAALAQAEAVAFRANAAARAARSTQRRTLAARALAARRLARAHAWQMPIENPVKTSGFGLRWGRLHAGEDFAAAVGTKLVSMSRGRVVFAGQESGYGNIVKIRYWDGTVAFYAHMSHISVTEGQIVGPGQVVGHSGNTGHSTGPHLHLEIHPKGGQAVNPLPWLANRHIAGG